jgi:UDP-N-acetylglucosamine 2-epimerase (non-hydrolysing)/GDP/UDP-N,N'-diacetylbacillosamine 2-epimerase (hydrolysing)
MAQADGTAVERVAALGTCLREIAHTLAQLEPEILVLYGDRGEVLASAIAAVNLGIPVAHIQGGDVSGNVDELMRHAVTKLAHLHFPSSDESGRRIVGLGEEPWRVHVVGDNHVDPIVAREYADAGAVEDQLDLAPGERPIVVLQHPETTRARDNYTDMRETLKAVIERDVRTVVVYPCSDQGYDDVVRAIEERRGAPKLSIHRNIEAPYFWGLLARAAALVGNSSAGLIETPYFRIPAVNLGERQKGRQCASNVVHAEFGRANVAAALNRALDPAFSEIVAACEQPFGDGNAYRRIVDVLRSVETSPSLLDKRITY